MGGGRDGSWRGAFIAQRQIPARVAGHGELGRCHDGGAGVQQGGFRGAQANSQRIPLAAEMPRWRAPKEAVIEDGVIVWAHVLEQRDQVAPLTRSNKPTGIKRLLRHASFA